MNPRHPISVLFFLFFWIVGAGVAQDTREVVLDVEAPFSLAWTVTFPGSAKQSVGSSGQVTVSYKNYPTRATTRDLLTPLIRDGLISGPLSGWKVVARASSPDAVLGRYRLYAIKKGEPDYLITDPDENPVMNLDIYGGPFSVSEKYQRMLFVSAASTGQVYYRGNFWLSPVSFFVSGLARLSYTYRSVTVSGVSGAPALPGSATFSVQGMGLYPVPNEDGIAVTAVGSITLGPHRVTETYLVQP